MKIVDFSKLIEKVNSINPDDKNCIIDIVDKIDIDENIEYYSCW